MIGIINCDLDESAETNGAILLNRIVTDSQIIDVVRGESISYNYLGFIITGSRASHDSDEEWVERLREAVQEIHRRRIPCLCICFGMQVVANLFGGIVESDAVDEEGFTEISLRSQGNERLFSDLPKKLNVFQSHHDIVAVPPPRARVVAANNTCIQGFVLDNFYCLQFHPEISLEVASVMFERDGLDLERLRSVEAGYNVPERFVKNFVTDIAGNRIRRCENDALG